VDFVGWVVFELNFRVSYLLKRDVCRERERFGRILGFSREKDRFCIFRQLSLRCFAADVQTYIQLRPRRSNVRTLGDHTRERSARQEGRV